MLCSTALPPRADLAGLSLVTIRAADPRVARVEADTVVRLDDARYYPLWNLDMVDQRSTVMDEIYSFPDSAGSGVTAYVLDSGIRTSHVQFGGRASVGFDATGDGWNGQDCHADGHGTHVAGTIGGATVGMANRLKLVAVRVFDCTALGVNSQIIAGVDWVTQNAVKPAVANMSLGGAQSPTLNAAVSASIPRVSPTRSRPATATWTPATTARPT